MITARIGHFKTAALALGGKGKQALRLFVVDKGLLAAVADNFSVLVVVKPCAAHLLVFHVKAQRLYQMQTAARVGAEANDVARVGRNFRVDKNDVEHNAAARWPWVWGEIKAAAVAAGG